MILQVKNEILIKKKIHVSFLQKTGYNINNWEHKKHSVVSREKA